MRWRRSVLAFLILTSVAVLAQSQTLSTDQRVLTGTEWRLVSFGPAGNEASLVAGTTVTLKFGEDGRASGSTGCNSYGGTYQGTVNLVKATLTPILAARMSAAPRFIS